MTGKTGWGAITFDCFGTLVSVSKPDNPARAVATELRDRGIAVPEDWEAAYLESHIEAPAGAEVSLPAHVTAALASRSGAVDKDAIRATVEDAVRPAFEARVRTRPGAIRAIDSIGNEHPIGILSNCSIPSLVEDVLRESAIDETAIDAVITSVNCGWRKPDPRAFESIARELAVDVTDILHVGDDPATDGGATDLGASCLLVGDGTLNALTEVCAWD